MEKLIETKHHDIEECHHKLENWKKFKSDYEALQQRVNTLPDKLSYDIMVPFGPHAFMPGALVNTNKITVYLGASWFTEMSAKQASEFLQRRIQQCDKRIDCLQKEIEQHQKWLDYSMGVYVEKPMEIREEYIPEKEAEWREQHRKNVRAYRQQMAKERAMEKSTNEADSIIIGSTKSSDYYFERLQELEIEEKFGPQETEPDEASESQEREELQKMSESWEMLEQQDSLNYSASETEDDSQDSEDEDDIEDWRDTKEPVADERNCSNAQNSDEINKNTVESHDDNHQNHDDQNNEKHNKRVRWIDLSEAKSKCITFTHSKSPPISHQHHKKKNKRKRRNSSTSEVEEEDPEDRNMSLINSPSDIYKCFSYSFQQPKSILKSSSTETVTDEFRDLKVNDNEDNVLLELGDKCPESKKNIDNITMSAVTRNLAFTGEIQEHFGKSSPEKIASDRPKSLFKSSRRSVKT